MLRGCFTEPLQDLTVRRHNVRLCQRLAYDLLVYSATFTFMASQIAYVSLYADVAEARQGLVSKPPTNQTGDRRTHLWPASFALDFLWQHDLPSLSKRPCHAARLQESISAALILQHKAADASSLR